MPVILHVHTDTSDEWLWSKPSTDPQQPHLVRVAALLEMSDDQTAADNYRVFIVEPAGWEIAADAAQRHNISTDTAKRLGVPLAEAILPLVDMAERADQIHAYAADFHRHAIERSLADLAMVTEESLAKPRWHCLMRAATPICRLPYASGRPGYKFPKLAEAYQHMTGSELRVSSDPYEGGADLVRAAQAIRRGIAAVSAG